MQITHKIHVRRWLLPGLLGLAMCSPVSITYATTIETGFSPEGTALQLVLKTIETAQQEIRLMGYSFTSPEVVSALVRAKRRGGRCPGSSGLESQHRKEQQCQQGGNEPAGSCRYPGAYRQYLREN